ncbi:hypothetical protein KY358_02885 [Candidatus Woesearchaeota archaeon]|nr:hypothetical protein [Candidatus Woesearchaeota archaeon]
MDKKGSLKLIGVILGIVLLVIIKSGFIFITSERIGGLKLYRTNHYDDISLAKHKLNIDYKKEQTYIIENFGREGITYVRKTRYNNSLRTDLHELFYVEGSDEKRVKFPSLEYDFISLYADLKGNWFAKLMEKGTRKITLYRLDAENAMLVEGFPEKSEIYWIAYNQDGEWWASVLDGHRFYGYKIDLNKLEATRYRKIHGSHQMFFYYDNEGNWYTSDHADYLCWGYGGCVYSSGNLFRINDDGSRSRIFKKGVKICNIAAGREKCRVEMNIFSRF